MKVIYIYEACDGAQFNREEDCQIYEIIISHPHLFTICFYTANGEPYYIHRDSTVVADYIYNNSEKVEIHSQEELEDLLWLSKFCGWAEFQKFFTSPGTWIRKEKSFNDFIWTKE